MSYNYQEDVCCLAGFADDENYEQNHLQREAPAAKVAVSCCILIL